MAKVPYSVPGDRRFDWWWAQQRRKYRREGPVSPFLLFDYPGAAAAYSLRDLNGTDPLVVRVRRSSDNAEQDFAASQIDAGILTAWVGAGNDGFVTTWYDQSGNGNHATQATAASQPKIVSAGALVTENGKAALDFDGSDDYLVILNNSLSRNIAYTHSFSVNATDATEALQTIYFAATGDNSGGKARINIFISATNKASVGGRRLDSDAFDSVEQSVATLAVDTQYLRASQFDFFSSDLRQYINGILDGESTSFQTNGSTSDTDSKNAGGDNVTIGALGGPNTYNGTIQELTIYNSDQSANRVGIETNINQHYGIF